MPGSSLWLVPPPSHPLHAILTRLIESTLPAAYHHHETSSAPTFAPHLTLTSQIIPENTYGTDPQAWLDRLPLPRSVRVVFERVATQDVFFRRCYIKCAFEEGLRELAGVSRGWGVNGEENGADGVKTKEWLDWWKEAFGPHVSLIYGDVSIGEDKLKEIEGLVRDAGVSLGGDETQMGGWEGGVVWLVPTDRSISEWKPIATRTL